MEGSENRLPVRWYNLCLLAEAVARTVEELLVYQKALSAAHEISALLQRPAFQRDRELSSQLNRASIRVASDISEGFEQKTDRHFARYLYDSRGGTREIRTQLHVALRRKHISLIECERLSETYAEIGRMLSGLIDHLEREDRPNRRKRR
jgi:four helix bundle protein